MGQRAAPPERPRELWAASLSRTHAGDLPAAARADAAASELAVVKVEAERLRKDALEWSNERAALLQQISSLEHVVSMLPSPSEGGDGRPSPFLALRPGTAGCLLGPSSPQEAEACLPLAEIRGELAAGRAQVRQEIKRSSELEAGARKWKEAELELEAKLAVAQQALNKQAELPLAQGPFLRPRPLRSCPRGSCSASL